MNQAMNYPMCNTPHDYAQRLGLPSWVESALINELTWDMKSDRYWGSSPDERKEMVALCEQLKKGLPQDALEKVEFIENRLYNRALIAREVMFYLGVKEGIKLYKEYQSI